MCIRDRSDRISHRRGKRTPFIFIGTILAVIFMLMLPEAANSRNVIWFVGALFMTLISMSIFRSPAVSLMPDVTPKPLRSKGNAIINLMGAVGIIMALGLIMVLVGDGNTPDYEPLFISIAVIMVAALLIILFKVDENKMVAQRIAQEKMCIRDRRRPAANALRLSAQVRQMVWRCLLYTS